jgi:lysophospholipase L1-like esterase
LRERFTGRPIDVLNAGVIGYTVSQGLTKYGAKVRPWHPKIVIVAFGAINEMMPALDGSDRERAERWPGAFASQSALLLDQVWKLRTVQFFGAALLQARRQERRDLVNRVLQNEIAFERGDPYQSRMSRDEFADCLRRLVDEIRADRAMPILINPQRRWTTESKYRQVLELSDAIFQVARDSQCLLVDLNARFKTELDFEQRFFADTHHLNAEGNLLIAEELLEPVSRLIRDDRETDRR